MSVLRARLELARISNLPTVWANTVHGLTAGLLVYATVTNAQYGDPPPQEAFPLSFVLNQSFMMVLAMSLIYTGGMFLNDVCDATVDATERPTRPIPSGRVGRTTAGIEATLLLLAGIASTLVYPCIAVTIIAAVLVGCVVFYNLFHRVRLLGFVTMPVCRALVIMTAALAYPVGTGHPVWYWHVAAPAVVLAVYTALITLIAWSEAKPGNAGRIKWVIRMIAAMPLVDAAFLFPIGQWQVALFCVGCAGLTLAGQRWIKGS